MNVSFDLPQDIEEQVRREGADLNSEARETYLVELYRQERITQHQLAEALGLSRLETDGVLKRHRVSSGVTAEEMRAQAALAAEHGFDGVMTSEHHGGFAGYLPNPIPLAGFT